MWYIWLIAAGIFAVIEMATVGFLIFWLAIGSLIAMVVSFFTSNVFIQTLFFVISSIILILFTKPLVNKFLNSSKTVKTNSYSLIHKYGFVTADIDSIDGTGQVKVNGEIWSAKSNESEKILTGTKVEILEIDGVKLIVAPVDSKVSI